MGALRPNDPADDIGAVREQSIERVVVIFPGALGDLLLALPTLRVLRERYARARLTLVVNAWLRDFSLHAGLADTAIALDEADSVMLFAGETLPRWLDGRPLVFSWLGAGDDEMRARIGAA